MGKKHTTIIFKNKPVSYLKVKEGDAKVKVYDKEQHQKVETGGIRHWRCQVFSMPLDNNCGYAQVEYWGDKILQDGATIEIGCFHLKQKKWTNKNGKRQQQLILILDTISNVILPETPNDYVAMDTPQEETQDLVDVNEEFSIEEEPKQEEYKIDEIE